MVDFNEVRPHDALDGKTPAEVYRDSERRCLEPLVSSYPPEWKTRRVSKTGTMSLDDDAVFSSLALAGQVIGLKREGVLRWRAHFFDIDLGTIEIVPLAEVLTTDGVNTRVNSHVARESVAAAPTARAGAWVDARAHGEPAARGAAPETGGRLPGRSARLGGSGLASARPGRERRP